MFSNWDNDFYFLDTMSDEQNKKINKAKRRIHLASWILVFAGIICIIGALATPHWRGYTDYNEGIFQKCVMNKCNDVILFDGSGEFPCFKHLSFVF